MAKKHSTKLLKRFRAVTSQRSYGRGIVFTLVLCVVGFASVNFASADQVVSVLGPSEWKTSNSCVSGEYTMRSSVDWGPVRSGKRIIRNIKVYRGLKGDVKSGKPLDYTVQVETLKANGKWAVFKTYGPTSAQGPISWNPANPPHRIYGGTRVRIKSGVDGDSKAGCTVVYQGIEPENGQTPVASTQLPAAPTNAGTWVSGGALSPSTTGLGLERGSYGSLDSINNKGYAQIGIATVADGAGSALKACDPSSPLDPSVQWGAMYCFPYVSKWRFQGISGSGSSGLVGRSDIVIASQYNHDTSNDARLVVMNTTTGKYRYVTLVRPCGNGDGYCSLGTGSTGAGCKETHAGGLAWYKNTLLVADGNCYIAFDMNGFYQTKDGSIILPTTHYWHHTNPEKMLLSTAALDTTSGTPQILSTDYMKANKSGTCGTRLVARWDLNSADGDVLADPGSQLASADTVLQTSSICEVQGIASYNGMYFMNSSQGTTEYMHRFRTVDANPADTQFLMPRRVPEGIYIDTASSLVWSLVELQTKDDNVRVFSMSLPSIID